MNDRLLQGFLLSLLVAPILLSHEARLGLLLTFGIVLALVMLNLLTTTLVRLALPDGRVKRALLRLRRPPVTGREGPRS